MPDWPKAKQDELRKIIDRMNLCGCGAIGEESAYAIVRDILVRAERHRAPDSKPEESFYAPMGEIPGLWVEFAAKVCDSWGFMEHGTSIAWAWLTHDGELLLGFLREFSCDSDAWPEWAKYDLQENT